MRKIAVLAFRADPPLRPLELKVLLAVLCFSTSFSKFDDRLYHAQLARLVFWVRDRNDLEEWQTKKVGAALSSLYRRGIIGYEAGRGRGARSRVSVFPQNTPDFESLLRDEVIPFLVDLFGEKTLGPEGAFVPGKPLTTRGVSSEKPPRSGTEKAPDPVRNPPRPRSENPPVPGGAPEKHPRSNTDNTSNGDGGEDRIRTLLRSEGIDDEQAIVHALTELARSGASVKSPERYALSIARKKQVELREAGRDRVAVAADGTAMHYVDGQWVEVSQEIVR